MVSSGELQSGLILSVRFLKVLFINVLGRDWILPSLATTQTTNPNVSVAHDVPHDGVLRIVALSANDALCTISTFAVVTNFLLGFAIDSVLLQVRTMTTEN
jgi:hypothetical protein